MGQTGGVDMEGSLTRADEKHMRMAMKLKMDMGGMQMNMDMLSVSDGELMWMDVTSPMAGGRQVMKVPLDKVSELTNVAPGMGFGSSSGSVDPVSQIHEMSRMFDLQVEGVAGGRVTLSAEMNEETRAKLNQAGADAGEMRRFTLVLDEKTGFPLEMRAGGEDPAMVMTFSNLEFLDRDALPADTFTYTPPEGVPVMDLGAMMGAGGR
jgi:outer membrane lipoprotein-sorting protein